MNDIDLRKKEIGARIRSIRNELGLTMMEFGKKFDPPASDSIVSRWERGISSPNSERIEKIAELGNMSTFYLTTGKKAYADLTDDEKKLSAKNMGDHFKKIAEKQKENLKEEFKKILDSDLNTVETSYLNSVVNFLKIAEIKDAIEISAIIDLLIRVDGYKKDKTTDEKELNEFLQSELADIERFFYDYFFRKG